MISQGQTDFLFVPFFKNENIAALKLMVYNRKRRSNEHQKGILYTYRYFFNKCT